VKFNLFYLISTGFIISECFSVIILLSFSLIPSIVVWILFDYLDECVDGCCLLLLS